MLICRQRIFRQFLSHSERDRMHTRKKRCRVWNRVWGTNKLLQKTCTIYWHFVMTRKMRIRHISMVAFAKNNMRVMGRGRERKSTRTVQHYIESAWSHLFVFVLILEISMWCFNASNVEIPRIKRIYLYIIHFQRPTMRKKETVKRNEKNGTRWLAQWILWNAFIFCALYCIVTDGLFCYSYRLYSVWVP